MKLRYLMSIYLLLTLWIPLGYAQSISLKEQRERIIHEYIEGLGKADYFSIVGLFVNNGTVISTSQGSVNARDFFYNFLPSIANSATQFHQMFTEISDVNRMEARFHYNYELKDGEKGGGEYVDEFVFMENSPQLVQVYMFENLKFPKEVPNY